MFIGRKRELEALERLYRTERFQFPVIYGRRRVGKTALINQFIQGKDAIYFTGVESNEKQNLENFSKSIWAHMADSGEAPVFASFQAALEYVFQLSEKQRLILVIDEYPYVARASKSLASTLQMLIDQHKETSKLFLILCGSSMSFMENHVLAYKAPLYGRRTAQFKLQPFTFWEAKECFHRFSGVELAMVYGIVGGTPQYLLQVEDGLSLEENIKKLFLDPNSPLYEEPTNLLKQEVREPALYNAIISAIAGGASRLAEISSKVAEESSVCAAHLKNLISLGIVRRENPYGDASSRRTLYFIDDNMFRFWYRFVPENNSTISRGAAEIAWRRIEPHLSEFMGPVFEEICKQYLWDLLLEGNCPIEFTGLGRWWGTDPKTRKQTEIDIMGTADQDTTLFGECKWTNEKVDLPVLETLLKRGELFHFTEKHFYLFAKSGFTKGCMDKAKAMGNVTLLTYEEMLSPSMEAIRQAQAAFQGAAESAGLRDEEDAVKMMREFRRESTSKQG